MDSIQSLHDYSKLANVQEAFEKQRDKAIKDNKKKIGAAVSFILYDEGHIALSRLNKEDAKTEDPFMFNNMLAIFGGKPELEDYEGKLPVYINTCDRELHEEGKGEFKVDFTELLKDDNIHILEPTDKLENLDLILKDKQCVAMKNDGWQFYPALTLIIKFPNLKQHIDRFNALPEIKDDEVKELILANWILLYKKIKEHEDTLKKSVDDLTKENRHRIERCVLLDYVDDYKAYITDYANRIKTRNFDSNFKQKDFLVDYVARTIMFHK